MTPPNRMNTGNHRDTAHSTHHTACTAQPSFPVPVKITSPYRVYEDQARGCPLRHPPGEVYPSVPTRFSVRRGRVNCVSRSACEAVLLRSWRPPPCLSPGGGLHLLGRSPFIPAGR